MCIICNKIIFCISKTISLLKYSQYINKLYTFNVHMMSLDTCIHPWYHPHNQDIKLIHPLPKCLVFFCGSFVCLLLVSGVRTPNMRSSLLIYFKVHNTILLTVDITLNKHFVILMMLTMDHQVLLHKFTYSHNQWICIDQFMIGPFLGTGNRMMSKENKAPDLMQFYILVRGERKNT